MSGVKLITKFYTSYFANWRNFPPSCQVKQVSIARKQPPMDYWTGLRDHNTQGNNGLSGPPSDFLLLAPSWTLLEGYKAGRVDEKMYREEYIDQLSKSFSQELVMDEWTSLLMMASLGYEAILLLCWEKPGAFCHRHIVSEVFLGEWQGFECEELPNQGCNYPVDDDASGRIAELEKAGKKIERIRI